MKSLLIASATNMGIVAATGEVDVVGQGLATLVLLILTKIVNFGFLKLKDKREKKLALKKHKYDL